MTAVRIDAQDGGRQELFEFLEMDYLTDNEIDLNVINKIPKDPVKGFVPAYRYKICLHGDGKQIGTIELRVGDTDNLVDFAGHIGYEVYTEYRGRKVAAKACQLIKKVALAHGMRRLIITCNPDNWASRKTCEAVNARLIEIVDLPEDNDMYLDGDRQKCRYEWEL